MAYAPAGKPATGPLALTTSAQNLVSGATAPTITEVLTITLVCYAAATFSIAINSTTATYSDATALFVAIPMAAGQTLVLKGPWTLPSAYFLTAKASAATSINAYASIQEGS